MVVSRDWQEVSVLECILGGLHIGVDVERDPERAEAKLARSKFDAIIVDCDLSGTNRFLRIVKTHRSSSVPLIIVSGSSGRKRLGDAGANFIFEKPISVEQAVHTLSAARNCIMEERLRYHRQDVKVPVTLRYGAKHRMRAELLNLSQGGVGIQVEHPLEVSKLRLSFALPSSKRSVNLPGEVVWSNAGRAGIRFVKAGKDVARDLELWLERRYFQGSR